jgi:hypothetical protein
MPGERRRRRGNSPSDRRQFPLEVEGFLNAGGHPLPAVRAVDVGSIATKRSTTLTNWRAMGRDNEARRWCGRLPIRPKVVIPIRRRTERDLPTAGQSSFERNTPIALARSLPALRRLGMTKKGNIATRPAEAGRGLPPHSELQDEHVRVAIGDRKKCSSLRGSSASQLD